MAKKINEAQVKIDIAGLESEDLETLSRMLALAGQAERQASPVAAPVPSMGSMTPSLPPIAPLDMDSIGAGAEEEVGGTMDGAIDAPVEDPLEVAADSLSAEAGDFGGDSEEVSMDAEFEEPGVADEEEFSLDLSGQPQLESVEEEEEEEEIIEEEFDFSRMLSLAGLQDEPEDEYSVEGNPDTEVKVEENTFLPDLTISEDEEQGDSTDFGPYNTEADAVRDGQAKTNGVEGDHFVVITKGNKFYWRRVVDEDVDNRPEPEYYDNDGNENRVHKFEPKFPGTALGDNPLNVNESDESVEGNEELENESDEEVEDIFESLQKKYQQFLGDK